MSKRSARVWLFLATLGMLAMLPGFARDFSSWRTDTIRIAGTSIGQQSSHQAYNMFDSFTDVASTAFSIYWKGALRNDAVPAGDPREEDPTPDWNAWVAALGQPTFVRPQFTPNVPQAWNPVVLDLNEAQQPTPDHLLLAVTLEPQAAAPASPDQREQVLAAYWPQTADGLGVTPAGQGQLQVNGNRLPPLWRLRIRNLEPLRGTASVGVVTQPPILARVPAVFTRNGTLQTETRTVVFLVVGDGENEPARVLCIDIPAPQVNGMPPPRLNFTPPNPDYFDPGSGSGGSVMWSYRVRARNGGGNVPVAGISFANVGDSSKSEPLLFVTTADGQLICLNARAADVRDMGQDGDPAIDPRDPTPRWKYQTPDPARGFLYGMAPAVVRVPLTQAYPNASTITNALSRWQADEWLVFVADTWGAFRAFDASGVTIDDQGQPLNPRRWEWRLRWKDAYIDPATSAEAPRPSPVAGEAERFLTPPLVYQGNTPMLTSSGALVNGSADVGLDDEVIFASERGRLYVFDALGDGLEVGGNDDGRPRFGTQSETPRAGQPTGGELRWRWPEDDPGFAAAGSDERNAWPRELPPAGSAIGALGNPIPLDADYFHRSALAVSLGANANPDSAFPNLDIGDDVVYVPYIRRLGLAPSGLRQVNEYIGSIAPYPFVQAERPIRQLTRVRVTFNDGAGNVTLDVPMERLRVGSVKSTGLPRNPNEPDDTVYFVSLSWYDTNYNRNNGRVRVPLNATVTLSYDDTSGAAQTDGPLPLLSCYRNVAGTPTRTRASLSIANARLQLQSRVDTPNDEQPALVDDALFASGQLRPPSMMVTSGASQAGTLFAPTFFRGRIVCFTSALRPIRVIYGDYDPRLETGTVPTPPFVGDPGEFTPGDQPWNDNPALVDIGASVTVTDGWLYVTYRNGHTRAYSVQGGGAPGTDSPLNPPLANLPPPRNMGNVVRAPFGGPGGNPGAGIFITTDPANPTDTTKYVHALSPGNPDAGLLLEYGQTIHIVVDFGPAPVAPGPIDTPTATPGVDPQVLQHEVQAQIRSSNGAVQQLPGANRGVRPQIVNNRVVAVLSVFTGVPSPTNPLTPGTPLLWERQPANFAGELTYELHVVQPGVQWVWGPFPHDPMNPNRIEPAKIHYWETERPNGGTRFPTTGGTRTGGAPNWAWVDDPATTNVENEWAPLVSYNNPIALAYDPDGDGREPGGIWDATNQPVPAVTRREYYSRLDPGRKNGDPHDRAPVDGARSSTGRPLVPVVGTLIAGGQAKQILFGEHGKTSPVSSMTYPEMAVLRVADRSYLAAAGRSLPLRVQTAQLTKIGRGAFLGNPGGSPVLNNMGPNVGSFEQNVNALDDGPHGMYSSIPAQRVLVTKMGTALDLRNGSVPIAGRRPGAGGVWDLPRFDEMEKLAVQVDIPPYTADDVYATRWRSTGPNGAPPQSGFNPFFPGNPIRGEQPRMLWDRAEQFSQPGGQNANLAPGEDAGASPADPQQDDRFRRIVLYVDANGNGQLDLLPTYREAYRTFAFQVVVKPDMRLEAANGLLDFGDLWHGKKQPGVSRGDVGEIREWQWMNAPNPAVFNPPPPLQVAQRIANFYRQYWRPVELRNTGNVNLAYLKPEVAYRIVGQQPQLIGLPSAGNDPWRALPLINQPSGVTDPLQIFLRTSFDDQLLPDPSVFYAGSPGAGSPLSRGIWLQKAPVGAGQPASVAYVDPNLNPSGNAADRDPSRYNWQNARDTWLSLNIPTGTPLGIYSGSIRFYNDRSVSFVEDPNAPAGYRYDVPGGATSDRNGVLDRDPGGGSRQTGEPLEPVTDPPVRVKLRVIENMIHGRGTDAALADNDARRERDRRIAPAAGADAALTTPQGQVRRILLGYNTDRAAVSVGQSYRYDTVASQLLFDANRLLFPFDELPLVRDLFDPWRDFTGGVGFTPLTNVMALTNQAGQNIAAQTEKPSYGQNPITGLGLLAWTERRTMGQGGDEYRLWYQPVTPSGGQRVEIYPGGQPPDVRIPRVGVRLAPAGTAWIAVYAAGTGVRRGLAYTWSPDPTATQSNPREPGAQMSPNWAPEGTLATPKSLSTLQDPHIFVTEPLTRRPQPLPNQPGQPQFLQNENVQLPQMLWTAFAGASQRLGRTDVYLTRYRTAALARASQRGAAPNPGESQGRDEDYARVAFPRRRATFGGNDIGGDILRPNATRTVYTASGIGWLVQYPYHPVQVYLARADLPLGQPGSVLRPLPLLPAGVAPRTSTNGELVFDLPNVQRAQVIVDPDAGVVRFSHDVRTLARLLLGGGGTNAPDPVVSADYTPTALRLTAGDVSANDPVVVPVLSADGQPEVMDASWYRQQIDGAKWPAGVAVAGRADRLWVLWRRAAGRVSGGPTVFYKVLRPGLRVRAGRIHGLRPSDLQVAVGGTAVTPEEVNPQGGALFFPHSYEGQTARVTYIPAPGAQPVTEEHIVSWIDETGELPVPMDLSVNEGSLDAFASYEDAWMTAFGQTNPVQVRKLEKLWLFWSSTRGAGGEVMFATLAPRIGLEANVGGSITFVQNELTTSGVAPRQARAQLQQAAEYERRRPFTLPPLARRGPLAPRPQPVRR